MVGWAGKRSCTGEVTWPRPCSLFTPVFSLTRSVDCQARAVSAEGRRSPRLVCACLRRTCPLSIGQHNKTNHIPHLLLTVFTQGCFCLCKINCCSVAELCLTLCNPMDCGMPNFPVLHYLLEFAQTYVHWVSDDIQPSHPLLSPSPAFCLSQHQGLFQWVSSSHQVAKVLALHLQYQSFQWIFSGVVVAHCFNLHFLNDMMWSISSYAICHL